MCTVCGCAEGEGRIEGENVPDDLGHGEPPIHAHHHPHQSTGSIPSAQGADAIGGEQGRMVQIEQDILGKNNAYAAANRRYFNERAIQVLNLVSSPGSGKTCLLARTLTDLSAEFSMSVIEGDQQTSNDADRIRQTGARALQINTGKGCHLDAHMVGHALPRLQPGEGSVLFIENVGNLVCPAAFDLGEAHKVVILSVTEGEDKPIKYPDMFQAADLMLLNKIDLLPYIDFDMAQCIDHARRVNPGIRILPVSARSGEGMAEWYQWLRAVRQMGMAGYPLPGQGAMLEAK
jgi:hydrogenase nickel incorporation protein HypB